MEQNHNSPILSLILVAIGLMTETARQLTHHLIDNYDIYFKLLTLATLSAAFLNYVSKWTISLIKFIKNNFIK